MFWHGIQYEPIEWVIMGQWRLYSERRHSCCSSLDSVSWSCQLLKCILGVWTNILQYRTHLFVQNTISLLSLCKLIWRHWTYKAPVRYILSSVWVRLSIFSPLSIIQYVGLYVFSLPISLVMIEIIYILCLIIIIKSEVWTITHCLRLSDEIMESAVCLSIFLESCT